MDRREVVISAGEMARQREITEELRTLHQREGRPVRAYVETYGCQQNVADSQRILGKLRDMGCPFASAPE